MAASDTYELIYFPITGRAGQIRNMFKKAGVEFKDTHVAMGEDWKKMKESTPWGSVPYLLYNGEEITQTRAITRFVAKKLGYYPEDPVLASHCDAIHDAIEDCLVGVMKIKGENKEENAKLRGEALANKAEGIGALMVKLDAYIGKVGSVGEEGFAVGKTLTVSDFTIYSYFEFSICGFLDGITAENFINPYPNIKAIFDTQSPPSDAVLRLMKKSSLLSANTKANLS